MADDKGIQCQAQFPESGDISSYTVEFSAETGNDRQVALLKHILDKAREDGIETPEM